MDVYKLSTTQQDILSIYNFANFYGTMTKSDTNHPDGHKIFIELTKDGICITEHKKEIVWVLKGANAHLDYIGIKKNFRGGVLSAIHKNCIKVLSASRSIQRVTLKPLLNIVTMWLYLGFKFERDSQKDLFITTLIGWIDTHGIDYDISNIENGTIAEVMKGLRYYFTQYGFPSYLNEQHYYVSTLYKDVS